MKKTKKITKKLVFNAIELVLQAVVIVVLICCNAFTCEKCGFAITFLKLGYISVFASLLFMLINVVLCVLSIKKNSPQKDTLWHVTVTIIAALTFYSAIIQEPNAHICDVSAWFSAATGFCLLSVIVIVFLSFIKRSKFVVPEEPITVQVTLENSSTSADELKKYKDLLDSGAITQEEFDAKKKELLGL